MSGHHCTAPDNLLDAFPEKHLALEEFLHGLDLDCPPSGRQGHLIAALHKAQGLFGWLPEEVQDLIGRRLGLLRADIYGVISFYSFFTDRPIGEHVVNVCLGTACFVSGANRVMEEFCAQLGIEAGETTEDGRFTLIGLRCIGACSLAPVVTVDGTVHGKVRPEQVANIIASHS